MLKMSSRKQRQLLQLSIATLFLIHFLFLFSPTLASNLFNGFRIETEPKVRVRYDLKLTSIDGRILSTPLLFSEHWRNLGVEEYGVTQVLIDDLARALNKNNLEKAQEIYAELEENHFEKLGSFSFEVQHFNLVRVPIETGGVVTETNLLNSWSSDQLQITSQSQPNHLNPY